jgi:thiamine-monophosphate kinase
MATVPLSAPARALLAKGSAGIETLISGGDDYEVVCSVPENQWDSFVAAARRADVPVSAIGRVAAGTAAPQFLDASGKPVALKRLSYSHF